MWTGCGQDKDHWRDTGVRLQGPVVNGVQAVFAQHWVEEIQEVLIGEQYFRTRRRPARAGCTCWPELLGGVSDLEMMFKMGIASAQKELLIQNPYFIPDEQTVKLLRRAVQRGVEVKLMIPGEVSDSAIVRHAGHRHFEEMLRDGVKIFEFQRTLIHQKIMVIDGVWSHVG